MICGVARLVKYQIVIYAKMLNFQFSVANETLLVK